MSTTPDLELLSVLRDPSDRAGWQRLLEEYEGRISAYVNFLAASYDLNASDRLDIRQTALLRIVLESHRIDAPEATWVYWKRIIRSCVVDFARVKRRATEVLPDEIEDPREPTAAEFRIRLEEVMEHFSQRSELVREVLAALLREEDANETARRLGTTVETIYVTRHRIRREINRLDDA